jgi:hypothetical protein
LGVPGVPGLPGPPRDPPGRVPGGLPPGGQFDLPPGPRPGRGRTPSREGPWGAPPELPRGVRPPWGAGTPKMPKKPKKADFAKNPKIDPKSGACP